MEREMDMNSNLASAPLGLGLGFEDDEWDLEFLEELQRKEDEIIASRNISIKASSTPPNTFQSNAAHPYLDPFASNSQPPINDSSLLQKEIDRLSELLLFLDQEKLGLQRDRDDKEVKLKLALEQLRSKEAEIESLKNFNHLNGDPQTFEDTGKEPPKSDAIEILKNTENSVKEDVKGGNRNRKVIDDGVWSPPWKEQTMKRSCNESSIIDDNTGCKGNKRPCTIGDAGDMKNLGCTTLEKEARLEVPVMLPKNGSTSSDTVQTFIQNRCSSSCLNNFYYKLQCIWGLADNGRQRNLIPELFATCEKDLLILLQGTCQDKTELDIRSTSDSILSTGCLSGANHQEVVKLSPLFGKLHFLLGRAVHSMSSFEALVETLFEFCTHKDENIICSALRILNFILKLHYSSYIQHAASSLVLHGKPRDSLKLPEPITNESGNNEKSTSSADSMSSSSLLSRIYFKSSSSDKDWKAIKNNPMVSNVFTIPQEGNRGQSFIRNENILKVISVKGVLLFQRLHKILFDHEDSNVKLEAILTMNSIIMNSRPDSERAQFGPVLFYKTLSELLRKKGDTAIQLQAVQTLFLLLNCPSLLNLFCGCERGVHTHSKIGNILVDISGIEGRSQLVLESLSDCISETDNVKRDYKLLRCALHVLAFIAASGNIGVACLLGFTHFGCKNWKAGFRNCSGCAQDVVKEASIYGQGKGYEVPESQENTDNTNLNIPLLLLYLLNTELDMEEKEAMMIETCTNEILKERAILFRETFLLLHTLSSNPKYGLSVMEMLTDNKVKKRICCNVLSRIVSKFEGSQDEKTDIIELTHDLVHRISSYLKDT